MERRHLIGAVVASFLILAGATACTQSVATDPTPDPEPYRARYGRAEMEISCADPSRVHFERGLLLMHSFAWSEARDAFREAAQADPDCAMAYWGVAMSYYAGLHAHPSAEEVQQAQQALARALAADPPNQRERDYVAAAEAIYDGYPQVERQSRDQAYSEAMENIYRSYPQEHEAGALYALSLLSLARRGVENGYELQMNAAEILEPLFAALPEHPGVAHYLIHAYDDSGLRDRGLAAARRYATIAPAATHALHMPSHIFAGLGMWDENIASNQAVLDVSPLNSHSSMYIVYGYMQKGQRQKARALVDEFKSLALSPQGTPAHRRGLHSVSTRFLLDRHEWKEAAEATAYSDRPLDRAETLYVRGLGAARSGDVKAANRHLEALKDLVAQLTRDNDSGVAARTQMSQIHVKQIEAAIRLAENRGEEAVARMREAIQIADAPGVSWAPPDSGTGLPAHEVFGEILLELGRYQEAQREFEAALKRTPNRLHSVRGLARAAALGGDARSAEAQYQALLQLLADADPGLPEAEEARQYLEDRLVGQLIRSTLFTPSHTQRAPWRSIQGDAENVRSDGPTKRARLGRRAPGGTASHNTS